MHYPLPARLKSWIWPGRVCITAPSFCQIDELHLEHPFAGSCMLMQLLRADGHVVGRKHVSTLMKRMGIEALYRRPRSTKPHPAHSVVATVEHHDDGFLCRGIGGSTHTIWRDNIFIERFWRSLKYEAVYLKAYDTVADARKDLARYVEFYNTRRPHMTRGER